MDWYSRNTHFPIFQGGPIKFVVVLTIVAKFTCAADNCPTVSGLNCECKDETIQCLVTSSIDKLGKFSESSSSFSKLEIRPTYDRNRKPATIRELPGGFLSNIIWTESKSILSISFVELQSIGHGCLTSKENTMKEVVLENNAITDIPDHLFGDTPGIETIRLSANALTSIRFWAFHRCTSIRTIRLSQNRISFIHQQAFVELPFLKRVYLDENRLTSMPEFGKRDMLQIVTLNSNKIPTLPDDAFNTVPKLEELYIGNNTMQTIPTNAFKSLKNLKILSLSYNNFADIPANAFKGLDSIEHISLSHSGVRRISNAAFDDVSKHLKHLSLAGNDLEALCYAPFRCFIANTSVFDLRKNKLRCDCGLSWIQKTRDRHPDKCASPDASKDIFTFAVNNCPLADADMSAVCRGEVFYDCIGQKADSLPEAETLETPPETTPESPHEKTPESPHETTPEQPQLISSAGEPYTSSRSGRILITCCFIIFRI